MIPRYYQQSLETTCDTEQIREELFKQIINKEKKVTEENFAV